MIPRMDDPRPTAPPSSPDRVGDFWSKRLAAAEDFSPDVYWLAVPEVGRHYNARASGGERYGSWIEYCLAEFLDGRLPVPRMLSVGCGTGELERGLARLGAFRECDAWDVAEGAVATARQLAHAAGYSHIDYQVRDANRAELPAGAYDAVWFNSSLHHVENLERVCREVAASLQPDGCLFLNEYVGPSAFDFTARQKAVIRAAFELIPRRLRRRAAGGKTVYLDDVALPSPAEVAAFDPSEAVRSADILAVVRERFEVLACNPAGGTILQFLLNGIAGNFRADDPESMRVLAMLLAIEDTLIDVGDLESDFVVLVARPRERSAGEARREPGEARQEAGEASPRGRGGRPREGPLERGLAGLRTRLRGTDSALLRRAWRLYRAVGRRLRRQR
jgi:SAM-dependent methyltransferase